MGLKARRARKTKFGEPLISYSIMLRREQVEYLKERENASDWVREAIDEKMEREGGEVKAVDLVAVSRRITFLEQRIEALKKTSEYVRAKHIVRRFSPKYLKEMKEQLTKEEAEMEFGTTSSGRIWVTWQGGLLCGKAREEEYPIPGWTMETLAEFLYKHTKGSRGKVPPEYALIIIDRMAEGFPYEAKLIEGYEKRMAELQAEIQKLKEKVTK